MTSLLLYIAILLLIGIGIFYFFNNRMSGLIRLQIQHVIEEAVKDAGGSLVEIKPIRSVGIRPDTHFQVTFVNSLGLKEKRKVIVLYQRRDFSIIGLYWDLDLPSARSNMGPPVDHDPNNAAASQN